MYIKYDQTQDHIIYRPSIGKVQYVQGQCLPWAHTHSSGLRLLKAAARYLYFFISLQFSWFENVSILLFLCCLSCFKTFRWSSLYAKLCWLLWRGTLWRRKSEFSTGKSWFPRCLERSMKAVLSCDGKRFPQLSRVKSSWNNDDNMEQKCVYNLSCNFFLFNIWNSISFQLVSLFVHKCF